MIRRLLPLLALLTVAACTRPPAPKVVLKFDQPDLAEEYYRMKREVPPGADPQALYRAAREQMRAMQQRDRLATDAADQGDALGTWTFLGPGNIGGRTRALIVDPNNADVMYAGAVSGGVWKTIDGGRRWEPVGDLLVNIAVNSLAMHPQNPNVIYAGTGEGYYREDLRGTALPLRGNGIFVTRNGGQSWTQLASTANVDFHWVNDLAISTHDPRRVYAATRSGVWRSDDEGVNWTRVVETTVRGGCLDLAYRGDTEGDYLFASCGIFQQATVYRSRNAESNDAWETVLREPGMSRTSLAIAPSNPSIVYALAASNDPGPGGRFQQGLLAVYRSDANGDAGSWRVQVTNTDPDFLDTMLLTNAFAAAPDCDGGTRSYVPMGWHCNVIAVDPTNPDRVWAAGVDLFRSDDGGRNWGLASYWFASDASPAYVHADQHVILFHPQYDGDANQTVWAANDGGVFRTDNATGRVARNADAACAPATDITWRTLNRNFGATQFYHGDVFPDGRRFLGGAQDNGTILGSIERGTDAWEMNWGGDGGYVAVDQVEPRFVYAESQGGRIVRSTDGGDRFAQIYATLADQYLFIAPFLIDPNQNTRLWTGGRQMWRTEDRGTVWIRASRPLPSGQVSAIAVAPGRPGRVIAGTSTGDIVRNDNANSATSSTDWPATRPRAGFVSSIEYDPTNADIVYATYAGFGGIHVWKSADAGATWTPLSNGLPDIPVHSIAIDPTQPTRLFLGTDLGVFQSTDGGTTWRVANTGFTAVVTERVVIGRGAHGPALYAFTHGRGAWRAELTPGARRRIAR